MSMKYLGETFDIHAGGIDLVFRSRKRDAPSEALRGQLFAVLVHFEHSGEVNMSRVAVNYFTFRDITARVITVAVRYFSSCSLQQQPFHFDALRSIETVASLRDFRARLSEAKTESGLNEALREVTARALTEFEKGMDDDLNTSVALAAIHNLTRDVNTAMARKQLRSENQRELLDLLRKFDTVLNVFGDDGAESLDAEIQALIDERQEARRRRDFARADELRVALLQRGIVLEDTKDGVRWKPK